jgi:hypothetical protein
MNTKSFLLAFFAFILISGMMMSQNVSYSYISPVPGSRFINPENNIAIRHGDKFETSSVRSSIISVRGSVRGKIEGTVKLSMDERTIIFIPDEPYSYNETIYIEVNGGVRTISGLELQELAFDFKVKEQDNTEILNEYYRTLDENHTLSYQNSSSTNSFTRNSNLNLPEDFPEITIMEFDNPSPGYTYYQSYYTDEDIYYLMVLDNYGTPVFYRKWDRTLRDFRKTVQEKMLHAQRERDDATLNCYYVLDKWYDLIDTLLMGNGYQVDPHDAELFENGNRLMFAYDPQPYAMDTVVPGGDPNATVIGLVIQELDAADNVIFQWRSWDHYKITDVYDEYDLTRATVDYVHGNALEMDTDSNFLVSCRHMNEITKIDRNTAEVIWRFGLNAENNMFSFDNDTNGFYYQHDVNRIANGHITIHDNGNYHDPQFSQAVEYEIDEVNMTAHLVWNYINTPDTYGRAQGSSQRLPDNNTIICWGNSFPIMVTETDYNKNKTWELSMEEGHRQYRVHKYNWVTDLFTTNVDTINYGTYDDYVPWPYIVIITNQSDQPIEITSTHNHWDSYYVSTTLPLEVPANGTANLIVNFLPTQKGQINDVLTLNYDSFFSDTLPQRISRQVHLMGYVEDNEAPGTNFNPEDGSTEVPQDTEVVITFSEPVTYADGSTIKYTNVQDIIVFKENEGEDVNYSASVNAWKTQVTLIPDTLKPLTNYHVEILANSISDGQGNMLGEAQITTFTTAEHQGTDENLLEHLAIYPNPTNGMFIIDVTQINPVTINIYDNSGKRIQTIENIDGNRIPVDLSQHKSGIYLVEVILDSGASITKKLLKE